MLVLPPCHQGFLGKRSERVQVGFVDIIDCCSLYTFILSSIDMILI